MRRGIVIGLALTTFVCAGGSIAGVGLANYAASGSFELGAYPWGGIRVKLRATPTSASLSVFVGRGGVYVELGGDPGVWTAHRRAVHLRNFSLIE